MKIKVSFILTILIFSTWIAIHNKKQNTGLDKLTLNNIEALAYNEGNEIDCYHLPCYVSPWYNCWTYKNGNKYNYCPDAYGA